MMPLLERIQFFDSERPFPHHPWLANQSISTRLSKDPLAWPEPHQSISGRRRPA